MDRPEHELLLACARICCESERKLLIEACLRHPIDWTYLLEAAAASRMVLMAYRHLQSYFSEQVPELILKRLQSHYLVASANNIVLQAELVRILRLLKAEGISAIPFKGPVLTSMLYEDPALREFRDIDILVKKKDVFRSLALLRGLGYPEIPQFSPGLETSILKHDLHYHLEKKNSSIVAELHWNLVPEYFRLRLPMDLWWNRAMTISFASHQVTCFSPEDLLMILSIHGCKHKWQYLQWIGDVARLLHRHRDMDWDYIFREYSDDARHILFISLLVAHQTLDVSLPGPILDRAKKDSRAVSLSCEVRRRLFHPAGNFGETMFQIRLKPSFAGRILCFFSYLSTPLIADYRTTLPTFLYPLYRLYRLSGRVIPHNSV